MSGLETANKLTACPACGHSAYKHWRTKGGVYSDATKYLISKWRGLDKNGKEYEEGWEFASNASPGNLPDKGCYEATEEKWDLIPIEQAKTSDTKCTGYNYFVFCDCPIDQETALALIRQGKTFK